MKFAGCLIALLTLWLAGAGLTLVLWRGARSILVSELLALGWLFGAGFVSISLTLGGFVTSGATLLAGVTVACLCLGIVGWKKLRGGLRLQLGFSNAPAWEKWLSLLVLFPVLYMAYASFRDALLYDGVVNWEAKARHAFLAGGALPSLYFSDFTRVSSHPTYPLYLPYSELWVYLWAGDCDQTLVKVLFPIFYAAAVLLLWSGIQRFGGRPWVATLTACVPIGVPLLADHGLGLVQGYADFPLATVYLAGLCYLVGWKQKDFAPGWGTAALCAGLLPWIKQDGLFLLAGLLAVAALIHGWAEWRRFLAFTLSGIAIAVFWKLAMHLLHGVAESDFQPITPENLVRNLPRLGIVLPFIGSRLMAIESWSLLWYWVPVALVYLAWRQRRLALWLAAGLFVPLALDVIPYLFSALNLGFHLVVSVDRLILQVSLLAVFCVGLAFASAPASEPLRDINDGESGAPEESEPPFREPAQPHSAESAPLNS